MKRVSCMVAKAIKEAGYPQDKELITNIGWYNAAGIYTNELPWLWEGDDMFVAIAPTYIEIWLWLWREKKIDIDVITDVNRKVIAVFGDDIDDAPVADDPEEAIVAAIEYLVTNDLIK